MELTLWWALLGVLIAGVIYFSGRVVYRLGQETGYLKGRTDGWRAAKERYIRQGKYSSDFEAFYQEGNGFNV